MLKKLRTANYIGIYTVLKDMSKRSGRNIIDIFIDMYRTYKKDGYTWLNYYTYNFDRVRDKDIRNSFMAQYRDNGYIYRNLVDKDQSKSLSDKIEFMKHFKDLLGRNVLNLKELSFEEFNHFINRHKIIFAKNPILSGGKGVERIDTSKFDAKELYEKLLKEDKVVLEELIVQHEDMKKLSLNSVNTIRVGTTINEKGEINIAYMVLRVSFSDSFLDNASQGGLWTLLNDDGVIDKPMYGNLPKEKIMTTNPLTGFDFIGFQIPMIEEVKELVFKAASVFKGLRYVGWDIAITEDGPILIEGNDFPTTELFQSHIHMEDGKGKREYMERLLGVKFIV